MKVAYYDEDAFYLPLKDSLEIGDTLIKTRGVTFFLLKKKHSNLKIDYACDGDYYSQSNRTVLKKK